MILQFFLLCVCVCVTPLPEPANASERKRKKTGQKLQRRMGKKKGAALLSFLFSPFPFLSFNSYFGFLPSPPNPPPKPFFSSQAFLSSPSALLVSSNTNQEMPAQGAILSRLGSTPVDFVFCCLKVAKREEKREKRE